MNEGTHSLAPDHIPFYIAGPHSDPLFVAVVIFVVLLVLVVGNLYLQLHSLPERMAHRAHSNQFLVIAILGLIALITHNNIYWIAALLLAAVNVPDFATPLNSIARSLERQTGGEQNDNA